MTRDRARIEALGLCASLAGVAAFAGANGVLTTRAQPWFGELDKPARTPPGKAFAPAWAVAAAAHAVSGWLVWRSDARRAEFDVPALGSYGVQMALHTAWPLLFFGFRRPALALIEICVLWLAVSLTIHEFARQHRFAAALLVPYLAWVTYTALINANIWWRNR